MKNKKLKVYLQYPWKFPDSPYYKYLIDNPPKNVEFLNIGKQGATTSSKNLFFSHSFKRAIRRTVNLFQLPILNAHLTKTAQQYDLIHCAHCLSKNKNKPWVADFEGRWQFYLGHESQRLRKRARNILLRKNCKGIIAWSDAVKKVLLKEFPELENKIEIIYPSVPVSNIKKKKHQGTNLIFVGRYFFRKGGLHTLEVMDRLTKKYKDVNAIVVSNVPEEIKEKYSGNKKIQIYDLMPQKELLEKVYSVGDIFVYPGYSDSFGFAFLEVMSFGIPIVTFEGFARDEVIKNDVEGVIINFDQKFEKKYRFEYHEPAIRQLEKETEKLIKNKALQKKMASNCKKTISSGRFSIKSMNEKLTKFYLKALN